jgi:hypothetical protein
MGLIVPSIELRESDLYWYQTGKGEDVENAFILATRVWWGLRDHGIKVKKVEISLTPQYKIEGGGFILLTLKVGIDPCGAIGPVTEEVRFPNWTDFKKNDWLSEMVQDAVKQIVAQLTRMASYKKEAYEEFLALLGKAWG